MRFFARILPSALAVLLALFFEQSGALNVRGVVPNLLLIAFTVLVCRKMAWRELGALLAAFIAASVFVSPFWWPELGIIAGLVLAMQVIRPRLTGNANADFFILLPGALAAFYGILWLSRSSPFSFFAVTGELVYTMLLGGVIWIVRTWYGEKAYSI